LAGQQGEYLGALLESRDLPWNQAFDGGPVGLGDDGPRTRTLDGGLQLTVLSPYAEQLDALRPVWKKAVLNANFVPGDRDRALEQLERRARYQPPKVLGEGDDDSAANGSSIALLAEHDGRRLLLAGDAQPDVLRRSLAALPDDGRPIHAYKLSHHGSIGSQKRELIRAAATERYLVSTNGAYYDHPSTDTMQLILRHHPGGGPRFAFNYASDETRPWIERTTAESGYDSELVAGRAVNV
ncbi:MAG TPA: hypothetical protein VKU40_13210, partial [Thermoanaerobaculia bacterium]|nr:hypothetical protein [Thermoanaerobaculia bacterium]